MAICAWQVAGKSATDENWDGRVRPIITSTMGLGVERTSACSDGMTKLVFTFFSELHLEAVK